VGVKLVELRLVGCAVGMSGVLMMGLDGGLCPVSTYITQHESKLIAFFALLPPPLDNGQHIEHLLDARDPTVRRLIGELLLCPICD
jgi:hypothetical protein